MTQAQLGEKIGVDGKQVRRILDLNHESKLSQLESALAALGLMASVAIASVVSPVHSAARPLNAD